MPPAGRSSPSPPLAVPLTVSWNLTRRCNLACAHCYIEAGARARTDGELSAGESVRVLHSLARVHSEAVLILTGGEPLLRPDLFDLIGEASQLGFWTVLGSHGGLLDERAADRLLAAGLKGAGVSLDSLDASRHDGFRGIRGAWERTVGALGVMRSKGLPFLIEMTATRENRGELAAMAEFAVERGATALNVFFLVPTGRAARLSDLSPEEYEESLLELARLQTRFSGRLLVNAKCAPHYRRVLWELDRDSPFVRTFRGGGCPAGTSYCRIGPEGSLTPCPYMPLTVGSLREASFESLWHGSEVLGRFREAKRGGRCGECEFSQLCGGCRCRAYASTGDYLAEDPSCVYRPGTHGGKTITLAAESTYGASEAGELSWTPGAEALLKAIPFFARGMVRRAVEKAAREQRLTEVGEDWMRELRRRMAGRFPISRD